MLAFIIILLLRLRDRAADLLISMKKRLTNLGPEKSENDEEKRIVRLIEPDACHQNNSETHLKRIEALEKSLREKEEIIKKYEANKEENLKQILSLQKNSTEEIDKMKKTVSDLEEEIETVIAEKSELQLKLQSCLEAEEGKKKLESVLEKSQETVENQKTTITNLENKLKSQGKISQRMIFFSNIAFYRGTDKNSDQNKTGEKPTL